MCNINDMKDMDRLQRYLCFGSESCFKVCSSPVGPVPAFLMNLLGDGKGEEVVREVIRCHTDKKYVHRTGMFITLAVCVRTECQKTKQAALKAVQEICILPSDLFGFVHYAMSVAESQKGWGRAMRNMVHTWYNSKNGKQLAALTTRFKTSSGWSHVDLLRLSHVKASNPGVDVVLKYLAKGIEAAKKAFDEDSSSEIQDILQYLQAVDTIKHSSDEHQVARLVEQYALTKEHIPTPMLKSIEVWTSLVSSLPLCEVLDSFGKMTVVGLLERDSSAASTIVSRLNDASQVKTSGISPMATLVALRVYEHTIYKSKDRLTRNIAVINSLNTAMASAISENMPKTNKRYMIAVKLGHNHAPVRGTHRSNSVRGTSALSPTFAVAGLAHILVNVEPLCQLVYFKSEVTPISISKEKKLADICKEIAETSASMEAVFGRCDLSAPIQWAGKKKIPIDVFIILTDNKDSTGNCKPSDAIRKYRNDLDLPQAKLVICGLTAGHVQHADLNDCNMLDIAGFNPSVCEVISNFAAGNI